MVRSWHQKNDDEGTKDLSFKVGLNETIPAEIKNSSGVILLETDTGTYVLDVNAKSDMTAALRIRRSEDVGNVLVVQEGSDVCGTIYATAVPTYELLKISASTAGVFGILKLGNNFSCFEKYAQTENSTPATGWDIPPGLIGGGAGPGVLKGTVLASDDGYTSIGIWDVLVNYKYNGSTLTILDDTITADSSNTGTLALSVSSVNNKMRFTLTGIASTLITWRFLFHGRSWL